MNLDHSILTLLLLAPLVGAGVLALLPEREGARTHAWGALAVTLITFLLTLHLAFHFNYSAAAGSFQFEQNLPWITLGPSGSGIHYHLGVDGLSMWLIVLAGFLAPIGVLASWNAIQQRTRLFYTLFLLQQVAMLGIFVSLDLFLYYGFWEMSLVPMTLLIATFGRTENRRRAAIKFFLYAFIPSALLLVAHPVALRAHRNLRPSRATGARRSAHHLAELARALDLLAGLPRRLRREGSHLPAARLAAGGRLRSPHRRGDGARRQARPLLHPALQLRHLPGAVARTSRRCSSRSAPSASSTARSSRSSRPT